MKLTNWNWVHLLAPYILGYFVFHRLLDTPTLGGIMVSYILVFLFSMIPHMEHDVKTGRSFKTKHGKLDEYRTEYGMVASNMKTYINLIHIAGFFVSIYIYSKFY